MTTSSVVIDESEEEDGCDATSIQESEYAANEYIMSMFNKRDGARGGGGCDIV